MPSSRLFPSPDIYAQEIDRSPETFPQVPNHTFIGLGESAVKASLIWILLFLPLSGLAQSESKNELGLLLGAEFVPHRATAAGDKITFGNSLIFSANFARRLTGGNTSLFVEFPFAAAPNHYVATLSDCSITALATLYVTPSLRVNFARNSRLSPWVSGGFGYGLYEGSVKFRNGGTNPQVYNSTGTAQFGGGLDVRTGLTVLFPITLRGEVRDYYTFATPRFGVPSGNNGQHNVVAAGGFVIHF
jgi:hypothetical protein